MQRFDCSVFDGQYVTQDVGPDYLSQLELFRSDAAKEARRSASESVIELHNAASG